MTVRLKFDNQQHPQLVRMDKGGWLVAGRCANMLLKAETTDLGLGGALYDTSVTVSVAR